MTFDLLLATTTRVKSAVAGSHSFEMRTDKTGEPTQRHSYILHNGEWNNVCYTPHQAEEAYARDVECAENGWLE